MIPELFLTRMKEMLREEYPAFQLSLSDPPKRALHVNERKISKEKLKKLEQEKMEAIPGLENGYLWRGDDKVGKLALHHAGAFYMQEPAAMLPVESSGIQKGMKVLDICAAPGGKSTQIANLIGDEGFLLSNEYVASRASILVSNLERMGITNAVVTCSDSQEIAKLFEGYFDAVVVDAPCSGEGMFRKEEQAILDWSYENVSLCAKRQLEILLNAAKALKVGGTLIYSTCTYSYEENEGLVTDFMRICHGFELVDVPKNIQKISSPGISKQKDLDFTYAARRSYPHSGIGEGQFVCKMRKVEGDGSSKGKMDLKKSSLLPLSIQEKKIWDTFLKENLQDITLPTPYIFKNAVSLLSENLDTPSQITCSRGVRAGIFEKNRFTPEHWFFSSYGKFFLRQLNLSLNDERVEKYLRGETISCDLSNGWGALLVEGVPLGGIKVTEGVAKNHYPKGLRLRT